MDKLQRSEVKTELYKFAGVKIDEYGDEGLITMMFAFFEVSAEMGVNTYAVGLTVELLEDLKSHVRALEPDIPN